MAGHPKWSTVQRPEGVFNREKVGIFRMLPSATRAARLCQQQWKSNQVTDPLTDDGLAEEMLVKAG